MSNVTNQKKKMIACLLTTKKIIFFLAILFAVSLTNSNAQNTWTRKVDFAGAARDATVGFSIGSKGYLGTGSDGDYTKDFWEYDPATNTWTQKADFGGTPRYGSVGFSIGSKGYLGTGLSQNGPTKDFWEYDPAANIWMRKADFGGDARHYAAGFSVGEKGYIGTGNDVYPYRKDFWEYNPAADTWTRKADFGGGARWGAVGFGIGSKGYLGTGSSGSGNKDFWEYDPATNIWTRKTDFPGTARWLAVGLSISNKGYLGTGFAFYKDFWEYDPATNIWTRKADFPGTARYGPIGFSINGKGYVGAGNTTGNQSGYKKDFWEYTPEDLTCQPPSDLKVISTTDSSAKLGWTLPTSSIVGLIIHYHPVGYPVWREKLVQPNKESVMLNNLSPGTTYKWKIESVCADKISTWVNGPDFTTTALLNPIAKTSIYPNPANNIVTVNYTAEKSGKYIFEIADISGSVLLRKEANATAGANRVTLDASRFFKGVYFINIIHPDMTRERIQMSKE